MEICSTAINCPGCASQLYEPEFSPLRFRPEPTATLTGTQAQGGSQPHTRTPIPTPPTPRQILSFFYYLKQNHSVVQIRYMTDERK